MISCAILGLPFQLHIWGHEQKCWESFWVFHLEKRTSQRKGGVGLVVLSAWREQQTKNEPTLHNYHNCINGRNRTKPYNSLDVLKWFVTKLAEFQFGPSDLRIFWDYEALGLSLISSLGATALPTAGNLNKLRCCGKFGASKKLKKMRFGQG